MALTDTHTHLYAAEFAEDCEQLIQTAINKGVKRFFMPNIDSNSIDGMLGLSEKFPLNCFPMIGLHPCSVNANYKEELLIVEKWLARKKFYAIGEIGIDLYWDNTYFEQQKEAFLHQIELAEKYNLPIVIHSRNSFDEIYELLKNHIENNELIGNPLRGIFHCFSGNLEQAKKVIALGFKLGIGGVVTFKNSGLDKVISEISLEHIVLETDAPYLAPTPFRGKRNIPEYLLLIAEKVASIKETTLHEVERITTYNSIQIFGV